MKMAIRHVPGSSLILAILLLLSVGRGQSGATPILDQQQLVLTNDAAVATNDAAAAE